MINFSSPLDGGHGQQGQPLCKAHTCKRRGGQAGPPLACRQQEAWFNCPETGTVFTEIKFVSGSRKS